jgi:hypothetical protein
MSRRGGTVIAVAVVVLAAAVITGWPPVRNSAGKPTGARFLVPRMGAVTDTPYRLARNL